MTEQEKWVKVSEIERIVKIIEEGSSIASPIDLIKDVISHDAVASPLEELREEVNNAKWGVIHRLLDHLSDDEHYKDKIIGYGVWKTVISHLDEQDKTISGLFTGITICGSQRKTA